MLLAKKVLLRKTRESLQELSASSWVVQTWQYAVLHGSTVAFPGQDIFFAITSAAILSFTAAVRRKDYCRNKKRVKLFRKNHLLCECMFHTGEILNKQSAEVCGLKKPPVKEKVPLIPERLMVKCGGHKLRNKRPCLSLEKRQMV